MCVCVCVWVLIRKIRSVWIVKWQALKWDRIHPVTFSKSSWSPGTPQLFMTAPPAHPHPRASSRGVFFSIGKESRDRYPRTSEVASCWLESPGFLCLAVPSAAMSMVYTVLVPGWTFQTPGRENKEGRRDAFFRRAELFQLVRADCRYMSLSRTVRPGWLWEAGNGFSRRRGCPCVRVRMLVARTNRDVDSKKVVNWWCLQLC